MDKVSICNQALLLLGEKTIDSFEEDTREAKVCAVNFDDTRGACLRELKPNFAVKRSPFLAPLDPPAFGCSQAAQLPQDCTLVLDAWQGGQTLNNWTVEGRAILSEYTNVQVRYVSVAPDIDVGVDSSFVKAFAALLAVELSYALTNASAKLGSMMQLFAARKAEAENQYGQETSTLQVVNTQLTAYR